LTMALIHPREGRNEKTKRQLILNNKKKSQKRI
jgi:hypothetical protein